MKNRSKLLRGALFAVLGAALVIGSARLALLGIGWWIDFSDRPVKSDVLVLLEGEYSRSLFAAELYAQGYAPEIWLSRPRPSTSDVELEKFGIRLPNDETINRQILVKRGVPDDRIRLYGHGAVSTADEALALSREFPPAGKKILVVTSRYHARRSRIIFRRLLPEADVRVVAAPFTASQKRWWKDKEMSENAPLEIMKTIYFMAGGRMK